MKRAIIKRIRDADLWDKPFVVNNHYSYKRSKQLVNKQLRRQLKTEDTKTLESSITKQERAKRDFYDSEYSGNIDREW